MQFKKPNNSNDGDLQPYDPNNGEYKEDNNHDIFNYYARKMGGDRNNYPLGFPKKEYPIEYIHDYFNDELNWNDINVKPQKLLFLIDETHPKKRYLIFHNLLGYNENNCQYLLEQIYNNASKYKVFVDKGHDEWGFRVKIYMPIKFYGSDKQLIVKTCWLITDGQKPKFITAWYDKNFERNLRDEI